MRCKSCGAPVPLVIRKKVPRRFWEGCRTRTLASSTGGQAHHGRGLSDPPCAATIPRSWPRPSASLSRLVAISVNDEAGPISDPARASHQGPGTVH